MSMDTLWYTTKLPHEMIEILERDLQQFDQSLQTARTVGGVDLQKRDSKTTWINSSHWVCGLCYHYILLANRTNFLYDIDGFDGETMQYTSYSSGEYYGWHQDAGLASVFKPEENREQNFVITNSEKQRKLSIIVQLSNPEEYSGGEVQFMRDNGGTYFASKEKGTIIIFDSRVTHRARKVNSGLRKSLVGWVVGPRWK